MKKFAILLAVMACIGLSFSVDVVSHSDMVYVQACCMHRVTTNLLSSAYGHYMIYDGEGCADHYEYLLELANYLDGVMNGEEGVSYYYYQMQAACSEGTASECLAAKRDFYSSAKSGKQEFASGKATYLYFARSAILCGTSTSQIASDISGSASDYRECMQSGCVEPIRPPFPPRPPRPLPPILPPFPRPIPIIR